MREIRANSKVYPVDIDFGDASIVSTGISGALCVAGDYIAGPTVSIPARRITRPPRRPLRGGRLADLDRRFRRAPTHASAPGGMRPVSHQGEEGRGQQQITPYPHARNYS